MQACYLKAQASMSNMPRHEKNRRTEESENWQSASWQLLEFDQVQIMRTYPQERYKVNPCDL